MEFTWPQFFIPPRVAAIVRNSVVASHSYAPTAPAGMMEKLLVECQDLFPSGLDEESRREVLGHIRSTTLTEEIIKNYSRARSAAQSRRTQEIYKSQGILEAARFSRAPPMGLFKEMMILAGHSGDLVLRAMNSRVSPEIYFRGHDLTQLRIACENDVSCPAHQAGRAAVSEASEMALVEYFREAGVSLRTQQDLVDAGEKRATPDILFDSPVVINGRACIWLDNKDFTALPWGRIHESSARQAERNNRIYGPGGFCCRGSCVEFIGESPVFDTLGLFRRGRDKLLVPRGDPPGPRLQVSRAPRLDVFQASQPEKKSSREEAGPAEIEMPKSRSRKSGKSHSRKNKSRGRKSGGSQPSSRSRYSSRSSKATDLMSLTELQIMAKQRGLIYAGLSKQKLIEKINKYSK